MAKHYIVVWIVPTRYFEAKRLHIFGLKTVSFERAVMITRSKLLATYGDFFFVPVTLYRVVLL